MTTRVEPAGPAPERALTLIAPLSGVIVPLESVPDAVFAERLAGDGISLDPLSERLLAPCDAVVAQVHRAGHALTLSVFGLELMIHIGIDTVRLNGQGFTPRVRAGDAVRMGDPLISFDADFVATHAPSLLTQMVVTNMERVASLQPRTGKVEAGADPVLDVVLRAGPAEPGAAADPAESQEAVSSAPILVGTATGLHARPAARIAAEARHFTSDIRLVKNGHEANARSVVSILALEVAGHDTVSVVARGADAAAAMAAMAQMLASDLDAGYAVAVAEQWVGGRATVPVAASPPSAGQLHGIAASPGIAVGQVFQLRHEDTVVEQRAADPNHERRALDAALAAARLQLETLQSRLVAEADAERAAIFAAHQELLEDPVVIDDAAGRIRTGGSAAFAWQQAYTAQAERLLELRNQLLAGRAADLRDVGRRVLHLLVGREDTPDEIPPGSIIVAEDLAPSAAVALDRTRVCGICTTMGSATSHVAILARGMGLPAVAAIDPHALDIPSGTRVVLDGDAGTLGLAPSAAEEAEIRRRQQLAEQQRAAELAGASEPAVTRDGHRLEVVANIGDEAEAHRVGAVGGEGVGLLRTEFVFMDRRTAPDEDEQVRVYEAIARALGPDRILVIRTLDVGGDKPLPYVPMATEANPFLGERGIRLTLNRPDIFRAQIRAVLRAAHAGRISLMFPMVSTLAEWRAARAIVEEERATLGVPAIPVGIMVETSAAALLAHRFAEDADFFSIGTNDLTQYALAMDRSNPRLAPHLDPLHPAVLRLIEHTVAGARPHGRRVGVCGALASDLQAVPVLLGLGVDELSVSVPVVPAVKARVRTLSLQECRATARAALDAADGAEVRALVARRHDLTEGAS